MTAIWTPVALSADVPARTAMPVATPIGTLALWRGVSGRLAAFADRCPHRGMRLSHGFVRGEALSCVYHGWRYAMSGRCLRIPAHPDLAPPEAIRVERHEVEEADGLVWVATGVPAEGPPRLANLVPLRSLTVDAGPATVEAAMGAKADAAGLLRGEEAASPAVLVVPQPQERTLIHVLVPPAARPTERLAASRAAEALRRSAEALRRREAA